MSQNSEATKRQTDPQTAGLVTTAQPRELIEDTFLLCTSDTGTIVFNPHVNPLILLAGAKFNQAVLRAEFAGILHQIDEHTTRHVFIHPDGGKLIGEIGN